MHRLAPALIGLVFATIPASAGDLVPEPPPHLMDYVSRPDSTYRWEKAGDPLVTPVATIHRLKLTSQTWQGIVWDHDLQLIIPTGVKLDGPVLLWNQGGNAEVGATLLATHLALRAQAPVVFLYGIPKQPLFDGKREDALIAETFVKYLETGDPTWPLLFPMVKSVIRSMDAVQEFAKQELNVTISEFIISGASKRGWTTWLTAATGDKRVKAIIPMVIDVLNMPVQMQNQMKAFGGPSRMIADYTKRGLVPIPNTERGQQLWKMVDPYTYRAKYIQPKLIITGTNDPYWPLDAIRSYWDDLPGEKYLLSVPNAGHDLREIDEAGNREGLPQRAGNTIGAFVQSLRWVEPAANNPAEKADRGQLFPTQQFISKSEEILHDGMPYLVVKPLSAQNYVQWIAESETRDFRQARWRAQPVQNITLIRIPISELRFAIPQPTKGFTATFIEHRYRTRKFEYGLTTPVVIRGAASK